jgi:UDP-N-acetylglucosamine diphosphorylase / glucose-1-phosphate thymidylyltransferase / UDP-N-acetylgalactosamine diphosphorylase / glucosamine-1-phosphate N-acetyltransferase / galactosamine-1-phosphate N-acetyltransferase
VETKINKSMPDYRLNPPIQTAVILAAGQGKRLQPLTQDRSKAMLPVVGKPMVARVMDSLAAQGVRDFILVVNPYDSEIEAYFDTQTGTQERVRFAYQERRRGMADALGQAALLIEGPFILSACDNLVSTNSLHQMLKRWQSEPRPNGVLALLKVEPERMGTVGIVEMDREWIIRIVEKPRPEDSPSDTASLPLYCFSERILDLLPEVRLSKRGEYELQDAIQMLIDRDGGVCGEFAEGRKTVTNANDLLALNRHYLEAETENGANTASLLPSVRIIPPVFIEAGARVGSGCSLGPFVYAECGCWIGEKSVLSESVVLRNGVISTGSEIMGQIIG